MPPQLDASAADASPEASSVRSEIAKAENAIIRKGILQQGLVWPEAVAVLQISPEEIRQRTTAQTSETIVRKYGRDLLEASVGIMGVLFWLYHSEDGASASFAVIVYVTFLVMLRCRLRSNEPSPVIPASSRILGYHILALCLVTASWSIWQMQQKLVHQGPIGSIRNHVIPVVTLFLIFAIEVTAPIDSNLISHRTGIIPRSQQSEENDSLLADNRFGESRTAQDWSYRPAPELGASVLSRASFSYIGSFIFKHARTPATVKDIPEIRPEDKAAFVVLKYREETFATIDKSAPLKPVFYRMARYFRREILQMILWGLVRPWFTLLPPFFINRILTWALDREKGKHVSILVATSYAIGLFASIVTKTLCSSEALVIGRRLGTRINAIVAAEVYEKLLKRRTYASSSSSSASASEHPASAGKAQNIISNDAGQVAKLFAFNPFFFPDAILTLVIGLTMLFQTIGLSAIAAVAAMICQYLYQAAAARISYKYQKEVLTAGDDRLSLTSEIIHSVKTLKFLAWERGFAERLQSKRMVEMHALRKQVAVRAMISVVTYGGPIVISMTTFVFHTKILHKPLDAATAFTALSLFTVIRAPFEEMIGNFSNVISSLVSCTRVDQFLQEKDTTRFSTAASQPEEGEADIGFVNASFSWSAGDRLDGRDSGNVQLRNLSLSFKSGGLNLIIGPVASGKTSLLHALLGEMHCLGGKYHLPCSVIREAGNDPGQGLTDSVAFCSQTPWIQNDSIRNNILFGSAYNHPRYQAVLYACALLPDLATMEYGDQTQVGEKGTALSGGQKARISLARAIYSSARTLLLDDVLSAVDSHTANHLVKQCLTSDKLMSGRTCLLVTHATQLTLPFADYVVCLANGSVEFAGTRQAYFERIGELARSDIYEFSGDSDLAGQEELSQSAALPLASKGERANGHLSTKVPQLKSANLENMEQGSVSFHIYRFYLQAFTSKTLLIAILVVISLTEVAAVYTNWLLRLWTNALTVAVAAKRNDLSAYNEDGLKANHYLKAYIASACISLILYGARLLFWFWRGTVASASIYDLTVKSLLRSPAQFFDLTPAGRIMNRLSADISMLDQTVPAGLLYSTLELFATIGVICAIAMALPRFLFVGIFILLAYLPLGYAYITSSREVKRIESISRSPYYSHIGETISGVVNIRAYSDTARFTARLFQALNDLNRPAICLWLTDRWLTVRFQLGGACFALAAALYVILDRKVEASLAGFVLTYALVLEERIFYMIKHWAGSQLSMNSVERLHEYATKLPQEPQDQHEPPAWWPSSTAEIHVSDLSVRYAPDTPLALKSVSFTMKPSERVAIVGRTGSGKSTLALSFFRFLEAHKGKIIIDGVDISQISLHTLRDRLTIIPQDAVVYSGTVRSNLDPFDRHSDAELYDVLRRTSLLPKSTGTPPGQRLVSPGLGSIAHLDDQIEMEGKNLSAGQKQLLCLARGLLKLRQSSNILILDESTANLDHETDRAIQEALLQEIQERRATVLCIAHRLQSVMGYDKILVLAEGAIVEHDTPQNLLANGEDGSEFARLCKESGQYERLASLAKGVSM